MTAGLLHAVYKGKKWAKNIAIVLFSLAIVLSISGLVKLSDSLLISKTPLLVMLFVYAVAVYHFGLAASFKAFYGYQNREDHQEE